MFGKVAEWQRRKQELLICSEANRRVLGLELKPAVAVIAEVDAGIAAVRGAGVLELLPVFLTGIDLIRRWKYPRTDGAAGGRWLGLLQSLLAAMKKLPS